MQLELEPDIGEGAATQCLLGGHEPESPVSAGELSAAGSLRRTREAVFRAGWNLELIRPRIGATLESVLAWSGRLSYHSKAVKILVTNPVPWGGGPFSQYTR